MYVLGAGPPDLWDSWSKGLGEVKMMTKTELARRTRCVSRRKIVGLGRMLGRQLGASEGGHFGITG